LGPGEARDVVDLAERLVVVGDQVEIDRTGLLHAGIRKPLFHAQQGAENEFPEARVGSRPMDDGAVL